MTINNGRTVGVVKSRKGTSIIDLFFIGLTLALNGIIFAVLGEVVKELPEASRGYVYLADGIVSVILLVLCFIMFLKVNDHHEVTNAFGRVVKVVYEHPFKRYSWMVLVTFFFWSAGIAIGIYCKYYRGSSDGQDAGSAVPVEQRQTVN